MDIYLNKMIPEVFLMLSVLFNIFIFEKHSCAQRISEKKCEEYSHSVNQNFTVIPLLLSIESQIISINTCGQGFQRLAISGQYATSREFPHMALIGVELTPGKTEWRCSGALISDLYVLTSANCILSNLKVKVIRLGELNTATDQDDARPQDILVDKIISHPDYNARLAYNNLGLIKLIRSVKFNAFIRPICLPNFPDAEKPEAIVSEWGRESVGQKYSTSLQKVVIDKFSSTDCNNSYAGQYLSLYKYGFNENLEICYGSKTDDRSSCGRGAALQIKHPVLYCMYTLIGVGLFDHECGLPGTPLTFVRVYAYLDWIEKVVWG